MGSKNKVVFIIVSLLIITLAVFLYFNTGTKRINWQQQFKQSSTEPFNTYVLAEVLKNYFPANSFTVLNEPLDKILKTNVQNQVYFFVGDQQLLSNTAADSLLAFVKNGNTAFISTHHIKDRITSFLNFSDCYESDYEGYLNIDDTIVQLNFYHPQLKQAQPFSFSYTPKNKTYPYSWYYFDTTYLCGMAEGAAFLGYMNNQNPNFIEVIYGKGKFLFHAQPIVFTNYYLIKEDGKKYTNSVLAHLPEGDILWDEFSKVYFRDTDGPRENKVSESPLKYLLSQPPLRWAWYILLALVLLYVFFNAKRKQRVVPVAEPNVNTSLEFVETIGGLYYQQHNHQKLAAMKMKLFLEFIRNRYRLPTNILNDELVQKIALKAQLPFSDVQSIFKQYRTINNTTQIPEQWLIDFHTDIEHFINKCK